VTSRGERFTITGGADVGWGIRIHHSVARYPERVIFYSFGNPDTLLNRIRYAGFQPKGSSLGTSSRRGFPIRWQFLVIAIAAWNGLFMLNGLIPARGAAPPPTFEVRPFSLLALGSLFIISVATPRITALQRFILKEGRDVGEIRPLLSLLMLISAVILVVFGTLSVVLRRLTCMQANRGNSALKSKSATLRLRPLGLRESLPTESSP
jgi:hypothetical protein